MKVTVLDSQEDLYSVSTMAAKMMYLLSTGVISGNESIIHADTEDYVPHVNPHYIEKIIIEGIDDVFLNIR